MAPSMDASSSANIGISSGERAPAERAGRSLGTICAAPEREAEPNGSAYAIDSQNDTVNPQLASEWEACVAAAPAGLRFFTHEWFRAWLNTYGTRSPWTAQGRVHVANGDGGPLAVVPMALARWHGAPVLALGGYVQPLRTVVLREEQADSAAESAVGVLLADRLPWHAVRLAPIDLTAPGHRTLVEELRRQCARVEVRPQPQAVVCPELPDDFETFQRSVLGARLSKDVQYYERRLRREGAMGIRHHRNPAGQELERILRDCREIERRSWLPKSDEGHPRFMTELDFEFWRSLVSRGLPAGEWLDVWVMDFAGQPISFCLALTVGDTRYMIANQYDREYGKYSTGSVLYAHALRQAIETGVRRVDFGEGDLHYKGRWGGVKSGERCEVLAFRRTVPGHVMAWVRSATSVVRRVQAVGARLGGRLRTHATSPKQERCGTPLMAISGCLISLVGDFSAETFLMFAL